MTAPDFPTWAVIFSYKIWHPERELTTVQPAPFLIFIIDSRTWIVKRQNFQNTKDKNGPPASAFSGRAAQRFLTHSDAIRRFYPFS